jgi:hypothetical protein
VGSQKFTVGSDIQNDFILSRKLWWIRKKLKSAIVRRSEITA